MVHRSAYRDYEAQARRRSLDFSFSFSLGMHTSKIQEIQLICLIKEMKSCSFPVGKKKVFIKRCYG